MTELYISTDVETDGPIPGPHSMLSIGSAAYTADKKILSTFSANLETLLEACAHPKTAAVSYTHLDVYKRQTLTLASSSAAVANSCTFIRMLPSPVKQTTVRCGSASAAPIAAGKPNPIVPSPPEVSHWRGLRSG